MIAWTDIGAKVVAVARAAKVEKAVREGRGNEIKFTDFYGNIG